MNANRSLTRRRFLFHSTLAAATAPLTVPRRLLGGAGAPSNTLALAAIGIGGMGQHYLAGCEGERVTVLCDADPQLAGKIFQKYPDAARYQDFRVMLEKEAKNFDALIIATPDHTHAVILMAALQLGKHLYCAKPVTHTIAEARKVKTAVRNSPKLVTKTSVQSSATAGACATTELLRSGALGPVRELHLWCDHPVYPCGQRRPAEAQAPAAGFDWDLWLGPAPSRPYHSCYHPWRWRPWWDFGSGTVGDMACHTLHIFFNELKLATPRSVYGQGSFFCEGMSAKVETPECQSHANQVVWEYPARAGLPPMTLHWYDGGLLPPRPLELDHAVRMPRSGALLVGEQGKLMTAFTGGRFLGNRGFEGGLLLPEEKFRDFKPPAPTLRRVPDHYREWTQACKTGDRTACPLEFGCEMTEVAILGSLALRTGRLLEWDAAAMRFTNDPDASALLDPPYRQGWTLG